MSDQKDTPKRKHSIPRRHFLRSTAAVGAGLAVSPMIVKAENLGSNDLNIGIIGVGAQGQVLMNACLKIKNVKFRAVCDIWEDWHLKRAYRLLKKYRHDVTAYVDYQEMLANAKDLDGVIVATPDFWHAPHAEACFNADLNVYCEKEMSNTLEGVKRIVRAAKKSGKLLQIGHQRRSNPWYIHSYNKIIKEAKALGRITTINGQWNRGVQPDNGWPEKYAVPTSTLKKYGFSSMHEFRNWRWYKGKGGGPIVDLGSHQLDIYNWFLQAPPKSVMASGGTDYYDEKTHQWYDTVLATFEYDTPDGTTRAFYQTITTNSNQGYYETFMGDEGALVISESATRNGVYREQSAPLWDQWVKKGFVRAPEEEEQTAAATAVLDVRETLAPPKFELPIEFNDPYHKPHLENFFDAIRGNAELNCPAEVGYETAVTVLKVNEAVQTGRKITYDPDEFHFSD